jgi:hypothetical protein
LTRSERKGIAKAQFDWEQEAEYDCRTEMLEVREPTFNCILDDAPMMFNVSQLRVTFAPSFTLPLMISPGMKSLIS